MHSSAPIQETNMKQADFESVASDPNRLFAGKGKRDPGYLLREEQVRKNLTIKLPKLETKLRKSLAEWQAAHDGYATKSLCVI